MKVGTLSFEWYDKPHLNLADRLQIITLIVQKYNPDLLLCACDSLDTLQNVQQLQQYLKGVNRNTHIVVDSEDKSLREHKAKGEWKGLCYNRAYLIYPDGRQHKFAGQVFADSTQRNKQTIEIFNSVIEEKSVCIGKRRIFVLNCGEINVLRGCNACSKTIEEALDKADIIVNPTHDRMQDRGILTPKRQHLSRKINDKTRVYVSASNWNTKKKQKNGNRNICQSADNQALHTVFISGECQMMKSYSDDLRYQYREVRIPIVW